METEKVKKQFMEALAKTYGIISMACKKVGIARQTYYTWKEKDKEFAEGVQVIIEEQIDFVEGKLLQLINEGDTTATIFYLKTRGRDRGFGNKMMKDEAKQKAEATPVQPVEGAKNDQDFQKKVLAKQKYLVKLLKENGKYTPELSMQAKVVAQLLVRTDALADKLFASGHNAVSVEVSREGNAREKVSELERLYLQYAERSQSALRALGMNVDSKDRKNEGPDNLSEFMKRFSEDD